tara:strand:+ start:5698 stop:6456 length:759 start_codon:yes stop_codon:yes gene_type:complete
MSVIFVPCDCSINDFYKPCVPKVGADCILSYNCKQNGDISGCTSLDKVTIERRIQNQSRMPESQYTSALDTVTVSEDLLSFKGTKQNYFNMSSRVWSTPNNLRNQSDRSAPSRSGAWTGPNSRNPALGEKYGIKGYVNVPTRGNSTRSTITADRPGAMTPGGEGVDVKHGSYHRYLAKKKGCLLTKKPVSINTVPEPIKGENNQYWYRAGINNYPRNSIVYNSSTINNMSYKYTPVSVGKTCNFVLFKGGVV